MLLLLVPAVCGQTSNVNFGNQPVGTTGTQTFSIVSPANLLLYGADAGDFRFTTTTASDGGTLLHISFTPKSAGTRTASLYLGNTNGGNTVMTLSGTGALPGPQLALAPANIGFGTQVVGAASATSTISVTNTGNLALIISSWSIAGANAGDFVTSVTAPMVVAANGSAAIKVTFAPTAVGSRMASLQVIDNAPGSPHVVPLTGTGATVDSPTALLPSSLSFGNQAVGKSSPASSVTITNTGAKDLQIAGFAMSGSNPADFTIQTAAPLVVPGNGGTADLSVVFAPLASGARSATLQIIDNASGSPHAVALNGTGVAASGGLPATLDFGGRVVGTTTTFTISAAGPASILLYGQAAGDFLARAMATVNGSTKLLVSFIPTSLGTRAATLSVNDNSGQHFVALSGIGAVPGPYVSISPPGIGFADQNLGTASTPSLVSVENTGNANLNISGLSFAGTNPTDFTTSTPAPLILPPNGTASIAVSFQPSDAGIRTATLQIAANASNGSLQSVLLSGNGLIPPGTVRISPASASMVIGGSQQFTATVSGAADATVTWSATGGTISPTGFYTAPNTAGAYAVMADSTADPAQSSSATVTVLPDPSSCTLGSTNWVGNSLGSSQSGAFSASFDAIPQGNGLDANMAFSRNPPAGYTDLAAIVRFNPWGNIDVRNGTDYAADYTQPYSADSIYHFLITVNVAGRTYSVYVTPPGGTQQALASNYAFRGEQAGATSLSYWTTYQDPSSPGPVQVCNLSLMAPADSATGLANINLSDPLQTRPASPMSIDFAPVVVGNSALYVMALSNFDVSAVTVFSATVTGSDFSLNGLTFPFTLPAGASQTATVTFAPSSSGPARGSMSFVSSAPDSPITVALSGSGTAPLPHSVTLSWQPGTSSATGFNVYRSQASGGPYVKLNTVIDAASSFVDLSVQSGQTYYYVVTAVDSTGVESRRSNESPAIIPLP